MTARDRTVVMVIGLAAMVAAFWFLLLSPKKDDAASLKDKVGAAQTRLETAQASTASAAAAKARYAADYKAVANLGKAVPVDDDVPSLVYQLQVASEASHIDFESIKLNGTTTAATTAPAAATPTAQAGQLASEQKGGTTSTAATTPTTPATPASAGSTVPATQTAFAGLPPGASVGAAGLPTMPFTFNFKGSFFDLEKLLRRVDAFTKVKGTQIRVNGRLLTIDSIQLSGFPKIEATINATAFLLPDDQGLTAGATAQAPAAATAATTTNTGTPAPPVAAATSVAGVGR